MTGYEGCYRAADYIAETFNNYGLTVIRQKYPLVVPIDYGASVCILDKKGETGLEFAAYALWPNLIQTCMIPSNISFSGPLVYADDGELSDFNGKDITNSIVLMEFNSGDNWINAMKLGAKAVVFIAPSETSYTEARKKFLKTPIYFPRLYVSREEGMILKELALSERTIVQLKLDMRYVKVEAENIIGVINGTEPARDEDIIVVAAHYDTWSVVPRLAPGSDEATAIASLLELAHYFANNPPKNTIWFVGFSGHYQALAGARWFTEQFWFNETKKIWFLIGLDFSTDGNSTALLYRGSMYDFGGTSASGGVSLRWTKWLEPRIFNTYIPSLEKQRGKSYSVKSGFTGFTYGWWVSTPVPYMLDSEPFAVAHGTGFTIRTDGVWRMHWGHPLSTIVRFENLWPQVEIAGTIIYGLANEEKPFSELTTFSQPYRYLFTAGGGDLAGFLTVEGRVLCYNLSLGWYTPVPKALCVLQRVDKSYSSYPFSLIIELSDEDGKVISVGISGYGYGHGYGIVDMWNFEAFHINEETGLIDYAPDYGQNGRAVIKFTYSVNSQPYQATTVVFKSSSAVLFDLIDPIGMSPTLFFDPRFENAQHAWSPATGAFQAGYWTVGGPYVKVSGRWSLTVYDYETMSEHIMWGEYSTGYETVAMIFVPPGSKFVCVYRTIGFAGVLSNASMANLQGEGFLVRPDEELHIHLTAEKFVRDTFYLCQSRYSKLENSFLRNPISERNLKELEKHLNKAEEFLNKHMYNEAYGELILAWGWASQSYDETMKTTFDVANTSLIFFSFSIAFTLLFERLVFQDVGKRWINLAILFALLLGAYMYLHPASKIAENPVMTPLGISILMLFIFTFIMLMDRIRRMLKEEREKRMGVHSLEQATMPLILLTFSYAPRIMRKRKMRTALVLTTVLVITFALIAFTSIYPTSEARFVALPELSATYDGLLIKRPLENTPDNMLIPSIISAVKAVDPGAIVAPRVWHYPQLIGTENVYQIVTSKNASARVTALLGLSPEELDIYKNEIKGIWFYSCDSHVCIVSNTLAEQLQVDIGDSIQYGPFELTVIGKYDAKIFNILRELDGYSITPVNPNLISSLSAGRPIQGEQARIPLSWDEIIVVPYGLAYELGGYLASISIRSSNTTAIMKMANTFALVLKGVRVYMGIEGKVYAPSPVGWMSAEGLDYTVIPIIMGSLTILNTLIMAVMERRREIYIYSSVGLSPRGIALMFLVESIIYALSAGTLGYLIGIATNIMLVNFGFIPSNFIFNTSSLATMITIIISMLAIILSALYPAFIASKLITPSLERKWKIPTKPAKDEWTIPLPFSLTSEADLNGLLNYLREFFIGHTVESGQPFIVRDVEVFPKEKVQATMSVLPVEASITQMVTVQAYVPENEKRWFISIHIRKLSGFPDVWEAQNRIIIDTIRKQLLIWESLPRERKEKYMKDYGGGE
ncbi:MAG: M28 family peptidase [Thermoproteota archaeon]